MRGAVPSPGGAAQPGGRRLIEPAEVAELVAFLFSEWGSFGNGSSWVLGGGWTAR